MKTTTTDLKWINVNQAKKLDLSLKVSDWLHCTTSMTQRVKTLSPDNFRLILLKQAWKTPSTADLDILSLSHNEQTLTREILMYHAKTPCLYGYSMLPRETLLGKESILGQLGSQSIGNVLFSHPDMKRDFLEFAQLDSTHELFIKATKALAHKPEKLWARRSLFYLSQKPLLIYEVFLPGLFEE